MYYLMNVDYTVRKGRPVIFLMARDENGKRKTFTMSEFNPYFYVEKGEGLKHGFAEQEGSYTGIKGEKLSKVEMNLPRDVGECRKQFEKTWEADIDFPLRFLIDRGIYSAFDQDESGRLVPVEDDGKIRRTRLYVDIETESIGGVPDPREAPSMIFCIVTIFYDPNVDKEQEVTFGGVKLKIRGEFTISKHYALNLEEEVEMLKRWCEDVKEFDPDDIGGWNIHFDMCTIINRCKFHKLGAAANSISPMLYTTTRDRFLHEAGQQVLTGKVLGRSVIDIGNQKAFPNLFASYFGNKTFESYKLKELAAGDPKETRYGLGWDDPKFDYAKMNMEHPEFDIKEIVEHCLSDVMKTFGFDMKLNLVDHFDGIRRIAGTTMDKALRVSQFADILMLRMYNGYLVCPTKVYGKEKEPIYEGAHVVQPQKGFFKNVILLDFKQMYPLNAIAKNMSPETVTNASDVLEHPDDYFIEGDVAFKKKPVGIFPQAFEKLIAYRDFCKAERKKYDIISMEYNIWDLRQYSVKQLSASMYGFVGFKGSRFYDRRIAKSITGMGRKLIKEIIEMVEGWNPERIQPESLYGDTDSVMIMIAELLDPVITGKELEEMINDYYIELAEREGMSRAPKVEFEKVFKTLLFSGKKKRYAGRVIWEEGKDCDKIYVRGYELRSSITAISSRDIQTTVVEMICRERDNKDIRELVKSEMDGLPKRPWNEIGIPRSLRKELSEFKTSQANYLGVWFANLYLYKNFGASDRVLIYWVKSVPEELPGRIQLQDKEGRTNYYDVNRVALDSEDDYNKWVGHIDWDVQKSKIIEAKIEKILEPYGLSMSEIMSGHTQQKGDGYWGKFT